MKKKILHISFDYSKENIGKSTVVISDLINETAQFSDPFIISLRRSINPFKEKLSSISNNLIHLTTFGFPYGIFLSSNMKRMFNKLDKVPVVENLLKNDISLIHAHKLTYEGLIGYQFAKRIGKPLFISLRQTDFNVLRYRPDLKNIYRTVLDYSSVIFYIAPYMKESLKDLLSESFYSNIESKLIYLPNPIDTERFNIKNVEINNRFLTILWLNKKPIKRKNLYRLFQAVANLRNQEIFLDVIGYGDNEETTKSWTKKLEIENHVNFLGFIPNKEIPGYLSKYKAFLMPSHSETFGVAYAEALLCGCPILYTKGTGFDGLFDGVGVSVNSKSVESIVDGIKNLENNHELYRINIHKLRLNGSLNIFSRGSVRNIYEECFANLFRKNI